METDSKSNVLRINMLAKVPTEAKNPRINRVSQRIFAPCYSCGQEGHIARHCRKPKTEYTRPLKIMLLRGAKNNVMIHDGYKLDFATCRGNKFTKPHVILDAVRKFTNYKQHTSLDFKCRSKNELKYRDFASEIMIRDNRIGTKVDLADELTAFENGCIAARRACTAKGEI